MVMSSEVGVYDVEPEKVIQKGRLMPGKIFKEPWKPLKSQKTVRFLKFHVKTNKNLWRVPKNPICSQHIVSLASRLY